MSIATKLGDDGRTSLIGGRRVSKADLRVEVCGDLDELGAHIAFGRSVCEHADTRALLKDLQRQLFVLSEEVASGGDSNAPILVTAEHVENLSAQVHRIEQDAGVVLDWALPGDHSAAAALDIARTVCRRTERALVRLHEQGEAIGPHLVPYLNRLSDLLWLLGRVVESAAGVDSRLRDSSANGPRWSRAW